MDKESFQLLLALSGWIAAIIALLIGYVERRAAREEEKLTRTIECFTDGSRSQSVGIALIEGLWLKKERHHDVIVPLLASQIIYMLLVTESEDPHSQRNLAHMVELFSRFPDLQTRHYERCIHVCDAMIRKIEGEKGGMPVPIVTLKRWMQLLEHPYEPAVLTDNEWLTRNGIFQRT